MILLIDCPYLCYRAYFTTGRLKEGTVFGFLSALQKLRERFNPDVICFCFDGDGKPLRKEIYPDYKGGRENKDDGEKKEVRNQIKKLRDSWLNEMGWKNVFHQRGHEADDVIASICYAPQDGGKVIPKLWREICAPKFVIVSSDHDLYQLLEDDRVSMWQPSGNKLVTESSFRDEWGIAPKQWANVKAIAGCKSDNVPGLGGIGEKTAAKCLGWFKEKGLVPARIKTARDKISANADLIKFNLRLVGLPYEGTNEFEIRPDEATAKRWREWCRNNGMKSLERRERPSLFEGQK